jgi:hypothetical protein
MEPNWVMDLLWTDLNSNNLDLGGGTNFLLIHCFRVIHMDFIESAKILEIPGWELGKIKIFIVPNLYTSFESFKRNML